MEIDNNFIQSHKFTPSEVKRIILEGGNELYYIEWKKVKASTVRRFLRKVESLMALPYHQEMLNDLMQKRVYLQMILCTRFQSLRKQHHNERCPVRTRKANFGVRTIHFDEKKWMKEFEEKKKNHTGITIN